MFQSKMFVIRSPFNLRRWALFGLIVALAFLPGISSADEGLLELGGVSEDLSEFEIADEKAFEKSGTFSCLTSSTGVVYCVYTGLVRQIYVNNGRLVLVYPDSQVTPAHIQSEVETSGFETYWGVDVTSFIAFGVRSPEDSLQTTDPATFRYQTDFVSKAYSLLLAAKLSGTPVNLQMRGVAGGYLEFDRVWLME